MIDPAIHILMLLAFILFATKRSLTYIHALQQEEYDNIRFLRWIVDNRVVDKRLSLAILAIGICALILPAFLCNLLVFVCFVAVGLTEKDPRKESKKKLAVTMRVKRIIFPALALIVAGAAWILGGGHPWWWLVNIHTIPLALALVNLLLDPVESHIQKKFWNEAHEKLQRLNPVVIGITGSFGKTSVKHILGHILKTYDKTLITPGSVNTPMGIARIVREELDESHKFFIAEMGAYGPGSIGRLCRLCPPTHAVITAIGHAHYERFRSLETVAHTKYELAEAVLNKSGMAGKVVAHERTLRFDYARDMKERHKDRFIIVGEPPEIDPKKRKDTNYLQEGDLEVNKIVQLPSGLEVDVFWAGKNYRLEAPLYGLHHGHNIALAFGAAMAIGIPVEHVLTALKTTPQIAHRLEVRKQGDITIIDDAFNSNPLGFQSALDLLAILEKTGRKILITPGMVEMGAAHDDAHERIGEYAGRVCDVVLVVKPERIPSFIKGFQSTGGDKMLLTVPTFAEASRWIDANRQTGDIVLIENDLPDIYERIPQL